jgi:lysophospholipase L1-like esterase
VRSFRIAALLVLASTAAARAAAPPDHWVGTWGTAPIVQANPGGLFVADTTLRQIVHVSLGGSSFRVVFTNEFGTDPLTIGGASAALSADHTTSEIKPATARALAFSGHSSVIIPPGAVAISDPITAPLAAFADLAITTFLPAQTIRVITVHTFANANNFDVAGNALTADKFDTPHNNTAWRFLKSVDVLGPANAGAIVTFGDSITDGAKGSPNLNGRWPDILAARLQNNKATKEFGVVNAGIGGNRLLNDGTGPNALARFDRDVVDQAGVRYVIVLEAINDIGHAADPKKPYDVVSADDLIAAFSQLVRHAHEHGIKIIGATLTPYVGAGYASPAGEVMREAYNNWIRTTPELDGVIDFDAVARDPANPTSFNPAYDSGDHLHPKDAGYKAMGESIDLKLFK